MIKCFHKHISLTTFAKSISLLYSLYSLGVQLPSPQPHNAEILSLVLNYFLKQVFSCSTNKLIINRFITQKSPQF